MSATSQPPRTTAATPASTYSLPDVRYLPQDPKSYHPGIGLIGCGAITGDHLKAYRAAGYNVVAMSDVMLPAAKKRRDEFYPAAKVFEDHRKLLALDEVEVVDIATHPEVRPPLVADALKAGKHVLSQKPFVLDLDEGERLAELAKKKGVLLAVNQNGRWAPYFSYMREAVRAGLVGEVASVHCGVHWDHSWVQGTSFERIYHLILYDFAIHWFDFLMTIIGDQKPVQVHASTAPSPHQDVSPHLMGQAAIEFSQSQATLSFDGHTQFGKFEHTFIGGSQGTLRSWGVNSNEQQVELSVAGGTMRPQLVGRWFPDGFHGTMGELLCAIEDGREPSHSARNNLRSLELCFAACESAMRGEPVKPGASRRLPAAR